MIGDMLRSDPKLLFAENFEMLDNVLNRGCAYVGVIKLSDWPTYIKNVDLYFANCFSRLLCFE